MSDSQGVFEGAIGIDLGTTYSCVSVFLNDMVDIIPNDQGNRTTPSRVAFHNGQILVGDAAMNLAVRGAKNVIYDSKRMIGRKFSDKNVVDDRKIWPFGIVSSDDGHDQIKIKIENIDGEGSDQLLAPEEISAHVLTYLKGCAERHLGKEVKNAVVTVPAYFNDAQRERTRAAGAIAGLNVLRIVNEPTAAALCYGIGSNVTEMTLDDPPKNVLVFDFGGGTFDVSVITIDAGAFEVRSTAGHTHLGGQDVDAAVVKFMLADCKKKHQKDFADNAKVLAKFRNMAEKAKKALSHSTQHEIVVEGILDGDEYAMNLSRAKLEELTAKLLDQCMVIVAKAIKDSTLKKTDIHEVIMVGGSSRIPKIRNLLEKEFNKGPCCSVNPDEAIAVGAAIQASILSKMKEQKSEKTDCVILMDVVPLSIGVDVDEGKFDVLIPRNTTIPYHMKKEYSTFENNQTEVDIDIYEGERPLVKHNHKLGSFALGGITKAKKGQIALNVEFSVDANGLLTVQAEEEGKKGVKNSLVVKNDDRLSNDDIEKMVSNADQMRARDAVAARIHELVARSIQDLEDVDEQFTEFEQEQFKWSSGDGDGGGGDDEGKSGSNDQAEGEGEEEVEEEKKTKSASGLPESLSSKHHSIVAALHWFRNKGTKLGEDHSLVDLEARAQKAAHLAHKASKKLHKFAKKAGKKTKKSSSTKKRKRKSRDSDEDSYGESDDDDDDDDEDEASSDDDGEEEEEEEDSDSEDDRKKKRKRKEKKKKPSTSAKKDKKKASSDEAAVMPASEE